MKWKQSSKSGELYCAQRQKKNKIKCWEMFTSCWLGRVVLTAFLVLLNYESKEIGCIKPYLTCSTNMFPFFPQAAPLGFTSFRRFKIYQPNELLVLNISPLMEVWFLLLLTILAIFINIRQAPWSTRWMNRLENLSCIRPCKLEVLMALNTFQSLINIFLPWQIIIMERIYLTL